MTKRLHLTIDSKVRSTPYMGIQVVSRRYSKLTKIIIITNKKKSRARQDYVETLYLETRKTFTYYKGHFMPNTKQVFDSTKQRL